MTAALAGGWAPPVVAGLIALEDELAEALGVDVDVVSAGSERIEAVRRHSVAL